MKHNAKVPEYMEETDRSISSAELRETMDLLSKVFEVVRVVDPFETVVLSTDPGNTRQLAKPCFDVWGKTARCKDCISASALQEHNRQTKFEYAAGQFFYVIAQYIVVEHKECSLEMVSKIDSPYAEQILDRNKFLSRFKAVSHHVSLDALTGLFNHRFVEDNGMRLLMETRAEGLDMAIILLDIDSLKTVNILFGQEGGDSLIKRISGALIRLFVSPHEGFAARIGGDEFLLLLKVHDQAVFLDSVTAAMKTLNGMELKKPQVKISLSGGLTFASEFPSAQLDKLIAVSNAHLLFAKIECRGSLYPQCVSSGC